MRGEARAGMHFVPPTVSAEEWVGHRRQRALFIPSAKYSRAARVQLRVACQKRDKSRQSDRPG